jgi:PST family polysaccharide transporter
VKRILGLSIANSFSIAIRLLISLGLNKVLSIYLGPAGYAYFSQFTNAFNIGATLSGGMYAQPATKILSDPEKQDALKEHHSSIIRYWLIRAVLVALLMVSMLLFTQKVLGLDYKNLEWYETVLLFLVLVMASFNNLSLGIYSGVERFYAFILSNVAFSAIQLTSIWFLIRIFGLNGAISGFLLAISILFFVNISLQWDDIRRVISGFGKQTAVGKQISKLTLAAIVSLISVPLTYFIIRLLAIDQLGIESAGYWQAVWKLSDTYLLIFTSAFSMMLLPFLNKIVDLKEQLIFLRKIVFCSIALLVPFFAIIYVWSEDIICLLFSDEFIYMTNYLLLQFVGDVFKVINIAIGFLFLSKTWIKQYIYIELLSFVGFVTLSAVFINTVGESGIGIAYIANSMLITGVMISVVYSRCVVSGVCK